MRTLNTKEISETVKELCLKANLELRKDVVSSLKQAYTKETNKRARNILRAILENARLAKKEKLAICQDTGLPCVFVELGQDVKIKGDLKAAINRGIEEGYKKGFFRDSIIQDPLLRGKSASSPGLIYVDLVKGNKLRLTVLPKGFGCENKNQLKMFNPTAGWGEIKKFILDSIKAAGPDGCPPYVIGLGIGGTADYAMLLAKKALLRKVTLPVRPACRQSGQSVSQSSATSVISKLEKDLLNSINKLNIGPMGLGGKTTALAVNIETYPTHIAGLPVAVNVSCHATRSATAVL